MATDKILTKRLHEVERKLKSYTRAHAIGIPEQYIGGGQSKLKYLGLKIPQIKDALHSGFSFLEEQEKEILKTWDFIWNQTHLFEVKRIAITRFLMPRQYKNIETYFLLLKSWAKDLDNWEHSDCLSKIYAQTLERNPKEVYPILQKWNRSSNLWLRRQSIVSLLCYAGLRKKILPKNKLFSLITPLLEDPEYYVQKGVGWTLREVYQAYPKETLKYLDQNLKKISSTAFSAAVEKVPSKQKEVLKVKRKNFRKNRLS